MHPNEKFILVAAVLIVLLVFAFMVQYLIGRRTPKQKYEGSITTAELFSAEKGFIVRFPQLLGLDVRGGVFVTFLQRPGNGSKLESNAIVLGAEHYLYCTGPAQPSCDFTHSTTVKMHAPGKQILAIELAGCTVSGNCVTGYTKNGADQCIVFGPGLTLCVTHH